MWTRFATVAAVISAWLLVRPYGGIRHDARLYFAQALFGDDPAFLANDLLLANDQQMQFSIYGRLLDLGLTWLEPGATAMVMTVVGLALWIAAASLLGRSLSRRWWWLIALIIPLAGTSYGPHGIFLFAEGYATPRGIAEALVVAAIAFAVREKVWRGLGIASFAVLVHPLVAVSGLIAVVCIAAVMDRRWRVFVAIAVPIAVLAVWADPLRIGGADVFDTTWRSIVEIRSPQIFLATWDARGWELAVAAAIVIAAMALHSKRDRARRFSIGILAAGAIGLTCSWILADLLGSVLGAQLQLWRTVWLAQLGVCVAVALSIVDALERPSVRATIRVLLVVLVISLPVVFDGPGFVAASAVLGFLLLVPTPGFSLRIGRFAMATLGGVAAALAVVQITSLVTSGSIPNTPRPLLMSTLPSVMPVTTVAAGLLLIGVVLVAARNRAAAMASTIALIGLAVVSLWTWDARSNWIRFTEGAEQPSITAVAGAGVLVEDASLGFYTLFAHPVYFSVFAGAGVVFSRDLALDYEGRRSNAALVDFTGSDPQIIQRKGTQEPPSRSAADLVAFCEQPGAASTLLLRVAAAGAPVTEWIPPYAPDGAARLEDDGVAPSDRFFRYECSEILRGKQPSSD